MKLRRIWRGGLAAVLSTTVLLGLGTSPTWAKKGVPGNGKSPNNLTLVIVGDLHGTMAPHAATDSFLKFMGNLPWISLGLRIVVRPLAGACAANTRHNDPDTEPRHAAPPGVEPAPSSPGRSSSRRIRRGPPRAALTAPRVPRPRQ